jgi:hypothetical protein
MFDFFEIVVVVKCSDRPELVDQHGYIAGKSYEDGGPVEGYGVLLFGPEKLFSFEPDQIKSTGYVMATRTNERGDIVPVLVGEA